MTDLERQWHRDADREIVRQDAAERLRRARAQARTASRQYLDALYDYRAAIDAWLEVA